MTIIITGASKGIGHYLFGRFVDRGEKVIGIYNSTPCSLAGGQLFQLNITNYQDVCSWADSIKLELKDVVLINCAGINYNSFAHKSDIDKWNRVIDVNIKGTFNIIRSLLPVMRQQGYGRIINFSSIVAKLPTPGISAYAASKAALIGLSKSLAMENASKGITVNAINLGYVNLGMGVHDVPVEYQEKMKQKIPMGRFCEPSELFSMIDCIIATPYINGADIDLNGGIL